MHCLATRLCLHFLALPNAVAVQEWWRFVAIIWFILFLLREMEVSIFVSLNDFLISQGPQIQKIKNVNDIVVPFVGLCPILD